MSEGKFEHETTRRGFLRGTMLGTAAVGAACSTYKREPGETAVPDPVTAAPEARATVAVSTTINGEARELEVGPDESTLHVVRERLGLRGCKLGCGNGACGACSMQLDGTPVATCLLPATQLQGRSLRTIEGIAAPNANGDAELHPVQRAFMAEDAMQCGYCTPGFVVEAAAFVDRHRAEHGDSEPTRETIAAALAGHLCRCGAYASIVRAVAGACAGKFDAGPDHGPRVEALAKVTGAATYTVDVSPDGVLTARILRSPHAHAKLARLDYEAALAQPGVQGIVELTPAGGMIRYVGQELVALAAEDEASAEAALRTIEVEYELLPEVIGIDAALAPDAVEVYASRKVRKRSPNANEAPLLPVGWSGNLRGPFDLLAHHARRARRRLKAAEAGKTPGATVVRERFETQCQIHTTLEPRAVVAQWLSDRELRVHVSTQAIRHFAEDIAKRFDLRPERVEVIAEHIGGGFGTKNVVYIELVTAIELARICGRPVKLVNSRRDEITVGGSRPIVRSELALLDDGEGQPALFFEARSDAGVAVGSAATMLARLHLPHADLDLADYDVLNHAAPGTPFRGPGGPPAYFALEQMVDQLAIERGEDPVALRRRWNEKNEARARIYDWADALPLWRERRPACSDTGRFRRGVGLSTASWFCLMEPASRVQIDAGPEGIVISTAVQDIGTGTRSLLADAVAEVLGVEASSLRVAIGSSKSVHGPMSGGSRVSGSLGPAAIDAATQLRDELVEVAEEQLGLTDVRAVAGGVDHRDGHTTWTELLERGPTLTFTGKRTRDKGGYVLPPVFGIAFSRYLSAAGQVCEVEVDTRLGRVRVLNTHFAASVGRIYSPKLAQNQVEGGLTQGIGYALYEERRLDPRRGTVLTGNLQDYRLCGLGDIGELHVEFLPGGFEKVRGGGVGIGELCTLPASAAIANAVRDATGWRPTRIPLRPDRVLAGLASLTEAGR